MDYTTNIATLGPGFIFPILKPAEIQQCMLELGAELSLDELQDPVHHKEKLRKVFTYLLEICAGKTEEDFQATPAMLAMVAKGPHPELHQDFTGIRFYTCLRDLMRRAGYDKFSVRDLYAPTPKRLRNQLSAVINLAKFREEQLKLYFELNQPRDALVGAWNDAKLKHGQLKEKEQITLQASQAAFLEMKEVMRECEELEVEIARSNELQAAAREEAAALKKTANDLQDQVATSVWALQEAEAEEENLRLQVVSSPDRRKSDLLLRKERLRKVKEECTSLEKSVQDCKSKVVNAIQALQDLTTTNAILNDLQEVVVKHAALVRTTEEARTRFQSSEKKTAEVLAKLVEATRQLARAEEKINLQRKQYKLHMDASHDALELAKSQLLRVEKERREGMARIEAGEAEVRLIEEAINNERAKTDAEIKMMVDKYKTAETAFLERNQNRLDAVHKRQQNLFRLL